MHARVTARAAVGARRYSIERMRMIWIVLAAALASGCDDGPSTPAPGGCDLVVSAASACPGPQELCAGVCNAAHECCYPNGDEWGVVYTDCNPCADAAVDAPRPDAAINGAR